MHTSSSMTPNFKALSKTFLTLCLGLAASAPAFAHLTIGESNDITPAGILKLGVEPQIRMSEGSGANIGFFMDASIKEDLSWRAYLGLGETDMSAGASFKYVPFPDFEQQPAVGIRGDIVLGREANETFTVFRVAPMVSKQMQTEDALFIPYLAIAGGMMGYKGGSDTIGQLILGSDIRPDNLKNMQFNAELGTNLNKTFSYISFNVVYLLDNERGFLIKQR